MSSSYTCSIQENVKEALQESLLDVLRVYSRLCPSYTHNPVIKAGNNPVGEHDDMWVWKTDILSKY